jgi:hypothetical protein
MYWLPNSLDYKFLAEVKRLWELASSEEVQLIIIETAMAMHLIYDLIGINRVS